MKPKLLHIEDTNPVVEWFAIDNETLFYIILIIIFLGFFIWNSSRIKKDRKRRADQNFRKRYYQRRKDNK